MTVQRSAGLRHSAEPSPTKEDIMPSLVGYLLLFVLVGIGFIFVHLIVGKLIRPAKPYAEKLTIYECGEPTIGSSWVQFDLRFYVIALLFVIFDVEVAFFFPWAVVFGNANQVAGAAPDAQQAQVARAELVGGEPDQPVTPQESQAARRLAVIALIDILVFFGVLLVGFAYLWKRGDLAWVRSTAAEQMAEMPPPMQPAGRDVLVEAR
jgi:NADH-quinone oxidoreductase subunit A